MGFGVLLETIEQSSHITDDLHANLLGTREQVSVARFWETCCKLHTPSIGDGV
jgi:hypothetical protein